jgi:hypothetical protein
LDEYGISSHFSVLDFIAEISGDKRPLNTSVAWQILRDTGHFATVSNVARAAGYCSYYAKLSEAIGVRKLMSDDVIDRFAGKGNGMHKVLGLASLYLFRDESPSSSNIEKCVDRAMEKINLLVLLRSNETVDRALVIALLSNLIQNLDTLLDVIDVEIKELTPIVEQQFIDYEFHMRGTPDLILEDPKKKKAIVIDWKTSRRAVAQHDNAQVVAYSLLEARRLGFDRKQARFAVLGEIREKSIENVSVLPVVIRPMIKKAALPPHPVLEDDFDRSRYLKFENLVKNVCLAAEHLTILLTNQLRLTRVKPEDCKVKKTYPNGKMIETNAITLRPDQLPRGDPRNQKKLPCAYPDGTPYCNLREQCKFYFGRPFGDKTDYESIMWKLRYKVFDHKETDLLAYKAIQEIFQVHPKQKVIDAIRAGNGFRWTVGNLPFIDERSRSLVQVTRENNNIGSGFRIDVVDRLTIDPDSSDGIIGYRSIRDYENKRETYFVINEGKSVLVSMMDSPHPLLSLSVFGKIDEVNVENENLVMYKIRLPSKVLEYQMMIFRELLSRNASLAKDVVLFQTNVDLTHLELNAVDALHRTLDTEKSKERDQKLADELRREVIETKKSIEDVEDESGDKAIEQFLREIIAKGGKVEKSA